MIYKIKKLLPVLLISIIVFSSPIIASAYTYSQVFENVPPAILNWACPLSGWTTVTSSWNTPRGVGTNPHRGVDLSTNQGTMPVFAVWNGRVIYDPYDTTTIKFLIDVNKNGTKDDPVYYCYYLHLSQRYSKRYYTKGQQIGVSGYAGTGYHLHFGTATSNWVWYRNEINYRWTSYWCNGEDLDSFKQVNWNWDNGLNTARITIYFMDDPNKYISPSEVEIFYRNPSITTTWTDGGSMYYKGNDIYEYYFYGKYPSGTTINWLVRIKRDLSVYSYCWAPAKYDQPDPNPNSTSNPYAYYTNTINY